MLLRKYSEMPSRVRRIISRFQHASSALAMRGSQMPDDWPAINAEFKAARDALVDLIQEYSADLR